MAPKHNNLKEWFNLMFSKRTLIISSFSIIQVSCIFLSMTFSIICKEQHFCFFCTTIHFMHLGVSHCNLLELLTYVTMSR